MFAGAGSSSVQKQAYVPVVSRETCNQQTYYNGAVTINMMCAGYEDGKTDTCLVLMKQN